MYKVRCCGSNGYGQLGIGHEEDTDVVELCFQSDIRIKDIGRGNNHVLILLTNGELYASGYQCGYLDSNYKEKSINSFKLVKKNVNLVDAGWNYTVIVTESNEIEIYNENGVFSYNELKNEKIKYLRTSLDVILVVCESGRIFGWGNNKKGQVLGDQDNFENLMKKQLDKFEELKFNDLPNVEQFKLVDCCLGREYGIYLMENFVENFFVLIMRGKTDRYNILQKLHDFLQINETSEITGSIGVNKSRWFKITPKIKIIDLKSMWSSVHILYEKATKQIDLQSFGNNVYGQIYKNQDPDFRIGSFDVGTEHGVIVNSNYECVYCWGWGEHGNCGILPYDVGNGQLSILYKSPLNERIIKVFGGYANTWIVSKKYLET
jgi:protein ATS1